MDGLASARQKRPKDANALANPFCRAFPQVNHHKKKAMYLKEMTSMLLEKFAGRVPDTEAELKQLKGATMCH